MELEIPELTDEQLKELFRCNLYYIYNDVSYGGNIYRELNKWGLLELYEGDSDIAKSCWQLTVLGLVTLQKNILRALVSAREYEVAGSLHRWVYCLQVEDLPVLLTHRNKTVRRLASRRQKELQKYDSPLGSDLVNVNNHQ